MANVEVEASAVTTKETEQLQTANGNIPIRIAKYRKEPTAQQDAFERKVPYGFCVFDGMFYTGCAEDLIRIGCLYVSSVWKVVG